MACGSVLSLILCWGLEAGGAAIWYVLEHGDFSTSSLALHEHISRATFFRCPFNTPSPQSSFQKFLLPFILPFPLQLPFISPPNVRMYKKHRDLPIRQYPNPPFPSFAWVMTVQVNPPSPAYAYGHIRNCRAQARARARAHNSICIPARRSLPPGLHECPPSHPRSSTRLPPSPTRTRTSAILAAERSSEKLMVNLYKHPPLYLFLSRSS